MKYVTGTVPRNRGKVQPLHGITFFKRYRNIAPTKYSMK